MRLLLIGNGGREHAIAWKAAQSSLVSEIYCAPGNAGIESVARCVPIDPDDLVGLVSFAEKNRIDLTIVGPELPLTLGVVDAFERKNLRIFGPSQAAARLEGSKIFAKKIMAAAGIPTAAFSAFSEFHAAAEYVKSQNRPLVVKADGLAAGKGVYPCRTADQAVAALKQIMVDRAYGDAGNEVVIEDFLEGEEASFICFTDGSTVLPLPSSQDHKAVNDGDTGPNTGGMGAYSPAPVITDELHATVMDTIMRPLVNTMRSHAIPYKGILYAGLMIRDGRPQVLEFNVRFGDPETQPILYRLQTDLIELMQAVINERLSECSIAIDPRPAICVVMASGGYPGSYKKGLPITGLDKASQFSDTAVFHAGTVIKNGHICTSGGRVLGVTARGDSISSAIDAAYMVVKTISWSGVHFRRDIGRKAINR